MSDPWARPPQQPTPPPGQPGAIGVGEPPAGHPGTGGNRIARLLRDPTSIVLVVVIVLALVAAGLIGGELYARHRADQLVAQATQCVVQDDASVSFAGFPPVLWQWATGDYADIHISTAGNQVREIKGVKADISIKDVDLSETANSRGTIGALDATITWTADGIKQTIQHSVPLVGAFVSDVKTDASAGTIELEGLLGSIVTKPVVADGGISLQVQQLTGLGFTLPRETVQPALDAFGTQLAKGYPLGVHADSVKVTDNGVTSSFSTRNAPIPTGNSDPCFAGL